MGAVLTEGSWCKCHNYIGGPGGGYTTDHGNMQTCCTEIGRIMSGDIFSGSTCDLQQQERAAFAAFHCFHSIFHCWEYILGQIE